MAKQYYVKRTGCDDKNSLKHWKYIKREKVNGKWRYIYDDSELRKFAKGTTDKSETVSNNSFGGKLTETKETLYKRTDNLFDEGTATTKGSSAIGDNTYKFTHTTKTQGKISRSVAKGEKFIYDTFYDPHAKSRRKRNIKESINKASNWIKSIFK